MYINKTILLLILHVHLKINVFNTSVYTFTSVYVLNNIIQNFYINKGSIKILPHNEILPSIINSSYTNIIDEFKNVA